MSNYQVEKHVSGFQSANTTWHACEDRPYVIRTTDGNVLRDSKGRVRRWASRKAAQAVIDKLTPPPEAAPVSVPVPAETCTTCTTHYGDGGTCDEGKPQSSPHRLPGALRPHSHADRMLDAVKTMGATHLFHAEEDALNGGLSPFTGLPVTMIERFPLTQAGFNCLIRLHGDPQEIAARCRRNWRSSTEPSDFMLREIVDLHGPGMYCEAHLTNDLIALDGLSAEQAQLILSIAR